MLKDRLGRVTRNVDGDNVLAASLVSDYRYGPFGRLVEIRPNQSPTHPSAAPRTLFVHDPFGRLLSHSDPESGTTSYAYNGFDELKTSRDARSQLRTFNYDLLGRIENVTDITGTARWIYDQGVNALGRVSETISPATTDAPFTSQLKKGQLLKIPVKHGEGRYHADELTLERLHRNRQVLLRYVNAKGKTSPAANPNGSVDDIAGVCNERRNVFGLMPHPEDACYKLLGSDDGLKIFSSIAAACDSNSAAHG